MKDFSGVFNLLGKFFYELVSFYVVLSKIYLLVFGWQPCLTVRSCFYLFKVKVFSKFNKYGVKAVKLKRKAFKGQWIKLIKVESYVDLSSTAKSKLCLRLAKRHPDKGQLVYIYNISKICPPCRLKKI